MKQHTQNCSSVKLVMYKFTSVLTSLVASGFGQTQSCRKQKRLSFQTWVIARKTDFRVSSKTFQVENMKGDQNDTSHHAHFVFCFLQKLCGRLSSSTAALS